MDEGYCVIEMIFDEQNRPVDYRFVDVNPAFEGQTGIKDARGKLMRQIAPEHEQEWFDMYGRVALTGETVRFESGAAALGRYFDVCAFRVGNAERHRVGIVFNDITERRNLYVQLQEANDAKMKFLASMSHELRTPLNAILGYSDLLTLGVRGHLAEAQQADVTRITGAARYLLGLINDILNFTRLEAGQIEFTVGPVALNVTLDRAQDLVTRALVDRGLRFERQPTPDSLIVDADGERVQQILLNLLTNAIKFTPQGGVVSLASDADETMVHIHVRDTGCGIPVDQHERIFEPFVQLGRPHADGGRSGVGLGLAISRDLARRMKGDLIVQSHNGAGSDFVLSLPRTAF
jgi:signal transduction histidine kinase